MAYYPLTQVQGNAASGATYAGNPVAIGGEARTSDITAVTSGQAVKFIADLLGRHIILPYTIPDNTNYISASYNDTSAHTIIAAPGAGKRIYIVAMLQSNSSATGTIVTVANTSSTTIQQFYCPPTFGGIAQAFPVPIRVNSNTGVDITNTTNISATGSIYNNIVYFTAAN